MNGGCYTPPSWPRWRSAPHAAVANGRPRRQSLRLPKALRQDRVADSSHDAVGALAIAGWRMHRNPAWSPLPYPAAVGLATRMHALTCARGASASSGCCRAHMRTCRCRGRCRGFGHRVRRRASCVWGSRDQSEQHAYSESRTTAQRRQQSPVWGARRPDIGIHDAWSLRAAYCIAGSNFVPNIICGFCGVARSPIASRCGCANRVRPRAVRR